MKEELLKICNEMQEITNEIGTSIDKNKRLTSIESEGARLIINKWMNSIRTLVQTDSIQKSAYPETDFLQMTKKLDFISHAVYGVSFFSKESHLQDKLIQFHDKYFKDLTPESLESDQYILDLWKEWEPKHDN